MDSDLVLGHVRLEKQCLIFLFFLALVAQKCKMYIYFFVDYLFTLIRVFTLAYFGGSIL